MGALERARTRRNLQKLESVESLKGKNDIDLFYSLMKGIVLFYSPKGERPSSTS